MRTVAALLLAGMGALLGAYGILLWIAIPRSDTATSSLLLTGALLVVGGLALGVFALGLVRHWRRPRRP
ncbi:MAG TPA: hypothetical protein VE289_07775 [Gaiellaceae bacterium]|jgi:hypothetical protein|nr:hypothetical protein [Gaiellaceae bacterium]